MTEGLFPPHPGALAAQRLGRQLLDICGSKPSRLAVAGALVLGGAAAGLRLPSAAEFSQLAAGEELRRLGAQAAFMAAPGAVLDLRTWLSDLLVLSLFRGGGVPLLVGLGAVLGAGFGGVVAVAALRARAHPLAMGLGGGLAILGLSQLPPTASTYWLAVFAAALLFLLRELAGGRRWAAAAILGLCVLWANLESAAVLVPLLLLLVWLAGRIDRRSKLVRAAPPLLLVVGAALAICLNPDGVLIYSRLPLSLGQGGANPALALWSSPDFHSWSMRLVELAALALLAGYLLAGRRLPRQDALVGLLAAAASLLWAFYLPFLLAVVAIQAPVHLGSGLASPPALGSRRPKGRSLPLLAAALPLLLAAALLSRSALQVEAHGGATVQVGRSVPAAAADWLQAHPVAGVWYTSPDFGDYLASRFPSGHHLMCTTNPVTAGAAGLGACVRLSELTQGVMGLLAGAHVRLAVLPRADPGVAFLEAEGWRTRYLDGVAAVLAPPPSGP